MIVPAHPKEDVNASRTDKEKKVMKEKKNRNNLQVSPEFSSEPLYATCK